MVDRNGDLHFTVSYRSTSLQLTYPARSTLGELGNKLVELTGVAPHTLKLMLPKRPALQPMSAQHSPIFLSQSGITKGMMVRMMGSSSAEVATVSQNSARDRLRGFAEEEELARRRASYGSSSSPLPTGNYIFCEFRTLTLPGIELTPPPSEALKIMQKLASDRGITAIMNKYRWRVGVMTEMAPVGYVGVSPKCILGFNKNRGEEISLRLRTDDLQGFRKYESIKKTLLHELAHMVHDEHDEKFSALDSKLNKEAIALDWTKSLGHSLSGARFEEEEAVDADGVQKPGGHRLGGSQEQARHMDPRAAAAAAALRRFSANQSAVPPVSDVSVARNISEPLVSQSQPVRHEKPDPDDLDDESMVVMGEGTMVKQEPDPDATVEIVPEHPRRTEPYPDEHMDGPRAEPDPDDEVEMVPRCDEPDPDDDDGMVAKGAEPDPDDQGEKLVRSADPDHDDDMMAQGAEPDPDDTSEQLVRAAEPDPDDHKEKRLRAAEPDPDDRSEKLTRVAEPDPDDDDEMMTKGAEPDPDGQNEKMPSRAEPDPDNSGRNTCKRAAGEAHSPTVNRDYKHSCSF